ncbi:DUF3563 family protein [Collimonas fungivorans]|uniref:DUF3563 family protein n=1 Tax=Collimonas fungivorans TaxID=158899 RepID=UPI003FA39840
MGKDYSDCATQQLACGERKTKEEYIMSTMTISNSSSISRPAASVQTAGVLTSIAAFFKRVGTAYERSEAARKEAYLAEAVDLYDLEYRMQRLDRESAQTAAWIKGF